MNTNRIFASYFVATSSWFREAQAKDTRDATWLADWSEEAQWLPKLGLDIFTTSLFFFRDQNQN